MVEELKVAVKVEREDNGWIAKESLCKAIISAVDKNSEVAGLVKHNHAKACKRDIWTLSFRAYRVFWIN